MPAVRESDATEVVTSPVEKIKTYFQNRKNKVKSDVERTDRSSLWGKIGFGLSLASVVAWLYPLAGLVVAITGLVFNILGLQAKKGRWFAVAGLTLSIVFLMLTFVYAFYGILISMFTSSGI